MCEAIDSSTDQFRLTPAEWRGCAEGGVNCQRAGRISMLNRLLIVGFFAVSSAVIGCSKKQTPTPADQSAAQAQPKSEGLHASMSLLPNESGGSTQGSLVLPTGFGKRTGDLDEMVRQRSIRALVIVNRVGFFYQMGRPQGIQYEALQEFQKFVNQKMKTGPLPVQVIFLPMRPDQLEAALNQGLGDIIAYAVVMTPEREKRVAFSLPIQKNVTEVVVTGRALSNVSSLDDLANTPIYVNPVTVYYGNLKAVSDAQQKAGKRPLDIKAADRNLFDDDLIEMVNAGVIPATVTTKGRADLWSQVLPNVKVHPELAVAGGVDTGWVMRKENPRLKQLVDEFVSAHAAGTSFGNTLVRRYLQNTKWIKDSTSPEELKKFNAYSEFFKKYASQYDFDYLMLAAQGYQESLLDQNKRSQSGAVGIMQVIPKFAAARPIDIPNVYDAEHNIHAGAKMLRGIADTYFNDPAIDALNKTLFTFASYNAGPNRIMRLRKKAKEDGLDPDKWFGNVELEVAKDIGQETVNYVGNIYKYYVAYKLTLEQKQQETTAG